ncbi:MAG TPA: hypothetical protein VJA16_19795, partial [Thermoanaerobaculia bacterium]
RVAALAAATVIGAGIAWFSGALRYASARSRAESQLGSLGLASFLEGAKAMPMRERADLPNAAFTLFAAASMAEISPTDRKLLRDALRDPWGTVSSQPSQARELLSRHAPSLAGANEALSEPWCDALIEYEKPVPPLTNLRPQFDLAALLLVDGMLALHEQNRADLLRAIRVLGREAACLEDEAEPSFLLTGMAVERLQHRLIAAAVERPLLAPPDLAAVATSLPSSDLDRSYRKRLRLRAARIAANHDLRQSLPRRWLRWAALRVATSHEQAAELERQVALSRALEWPAERLAHELAPGPPSFWQRLRPGLPRDDLREALKVRLTAASRGLARLALAMRSEMLGGSDCLAAWAPLEPWRRLLTGVVDARMRAGTDGSCDLADSDAAAYSSLGPTAAVLHVRLPAPGAPPRSTLPLRPGGGDGG